MAPFDTSWLIAAVSLTVPLLFASIGELVSERSGIINVGLEGMILVGAFCSFVVDWLTGSILLGVLAGVAGGLLMAAAMALLCVDGRANQIVVGLGLFIFGEGVTSFANQEVFGGRSSQVVVRPMANLSIPLLDHIPVIGKPLFQQVPLAYVAYLSVPLVVVLLWRTPWGLSLRASGETPEAVETSGMSVRRDRWIGALAAGAGGGLGGVMLTIGSIGVFNNGASAGRGFIALAAVVFGRWKPVGVLGACLVFGGADALQQRLQAIGDIPRIVWIVAAAIPLVVLVWRVRRGKRAPPAQIPWPAALVVVGVVLAVVEPKWNLPSQIWLMLPYVIAILVLAGFVGRTRVPSALGIPYRRASAQT